MKKIFLLFTALFFYSAQAQKFQEPKATDDYHSVDVSFVSSAGNAKMSGTLTYPKDKKVAVAVILLSGSGPQDRNSELLGHKPFLVLADDLTRKGIAVLRVDDRGAGKSEGNYFESTMEDFKADALAAVKFLKSRKETNKAKIGFAGHSLGASIAIMAASESKDVAFVALLAGAGVRGDKLMLAQKAGIERKMGVNEDAIAMGQQQFGKAYDIIVGSDDYGEPLKAELLAYFTSAFGTSIYAAQLETLAEQLSMPWLADFIRFDPAPMLAKLNRPVFAATGSNDTQVPATENLDAIRQATQGNKNVTITELPGLNHLFQTSQTGLPQEYGQIEETLSPALIDALGGWLFSLNNK